MNENIKNRILEKTKEIEQYLQELYEFFPEDYENYKNSLSIKAACERYFEKIIEAVVSTSFLFIRLKEYGDVRDEDGAFSLLANRRSISSELAEKLKEAKGMRNIIIHEYGEIENIQVYTAIAEELKRDTEEFILQIRENLD
jgi:uncharacterized protein YutE (UPF0331/DUF86 family)